MLRLQSDLVALCLSALDGKLDGQSAAWDSRAALGVVLAAGGYPDSYAKGHPITGLPESEATDAKVFHAGTALRDGQVVTNGGRVLCATALGNSVAEAQRRAYELADRIHWQDLYCRRDIGYRAVARERTS
jgi:phosphoribosylamine--glycine ligase